MKLAAKEKSTDNNASDEGIGTVMQGLAAKLAFSFGDVAAMSALYDDNVVWTLPKSFEGIAGPFVGRKAVVALNEFVNSVYDAETVNVQMLDDIQAGDFSAARFIYSATMLPRGESWKNEYVLFIRSKAQLIVEVHERLDTLAVALARGWAESKKQSDISIKS